MVRVLGRRQAVRIYELIAAAGAPIDPDHEQALRTYAEALEAYRKGAWTEALKLFQQVQTLRADDGPSRVLAQRCREFEAHPPETWDGVFAQQFK
jgi:adenylate cyclase